MFHTVKGLMIRTHVLIDPIHALHSDREFLAGGLLKGLSEHRNDFSLSSADKEIVILQRNMHGLQRNYQTADWH